MTEVIEDTRVRHALTRIGFAAVAAEEANLSATLGALNDADKALKRIMARATVPVEYERVEIVQNRGPTVEFSGKLLAETIFQTRGHKPLSILLQIYETAGGALIAASTSVPVNEVGGEDARVTVVPRQDDVQAMRFAVMDAFQWELRARSMMRKLGWSLRMDVE